MQNYDAAKPVNAAEWLKLDDAERSQLIERYHRKHRMVVPRMNAHVAIHVIVENQIAMGDEIPVAKTLERLLREGLCRHDAIHAIGSVLMEHMQDMRKHGFAGEDPHAIYYARLETLDGHEWLRSFEE